MSRVKLTHPERVLYPDDGVTKGDLFAYYERIAPVLVPHLRDRPFTLKRYPHGITGEVYFQKQVPRGAPEWIPTRRFTTHPRGGGSREVDFALVNSPDAVLWMVQMNCVDMNAWYSRVDKPGRPDFVVFDLDPPDEPDGFALAIEVAHLIRGLLDEVGLPGYVKTSGADGIHVLAPIQRRAGFDDTYAFAEAASRLLENGIPARSRPSG
jgi:bifunctional non-homologous end joining protein LigD